MESLITFTKNKLSEYNATPDEWEHFDLLVEDIKRQSTNLREEVEQLNWFVKHAADKLDCPPEQIMLETINIPACNLFNTLSMKNALMIVCYDTDSGKAIRYGSHFLWKEFNDYRKALQQKYYLNKTQYIQLLDEVGKWIFCVLQEYDISEEDGEKADMLLEQMRKVIYPCQK